MTTPINQHYIPQFLLRNFQILEKKGKEKSIFIFDKTLGKEYQAPIKQTAAERHFYEVKVDNYTIEDELAKYEADAGHIVHEILELKSLKRITRKEKVILSKFIAIQLLRVPAMRNSFSYFTEIMDEKFNYFEENGISKPTDVDEKIAHCSFILSTLSTIFPLVYSKDWLLFESESDDYVIGDNPVILHNTFHKNKRASALGLASEGIEIYMPISPKYCLALTCTSIRKSIIEKIKNLPADKLNLLEIRRLNQFAKNLKKSETVKNSLDNVIFINNLQTISAERFVYSHKKSFDLIKDMAGDYKKNHKGLFKIN